MSQNLSLSSLQITCPQCWYIENISVSKRELAFGLVTSIYMWKPCAQCGTVSDGISYTLPPIDRELLDEWVDNEDLHFSSQDEELLLLSWDLVPDMIALLSREEYIPELKRNILLYVLCELLDNYSSQLTDSQKIQKEKIIELLKRMISTVALEDPSFAEQIQNSIDASQNIL